ncbi:DUF6602 domain-containing protein [Sinorhizobium meliloti]|uniref:DUF6602 domain-containing protein n=1 Tax=Rhizobium meliloti TaxID=382 RepID=UPI0013146193|nr:DUF6602 domain-containing protein [Sinorhizobium meliloti]
MTPVIARKKPQLATPKRLFRTFEGHHYQLLADFHRSATHKLPGSKGMLREDAVAKFLSTWIPKRYQVLSNVFVSKFGQKFDRELDVVILDTFEGISWPLDVAGVNSVVTWDHVQLVGEVKSNLTQKGLDDAIKLMETLPHHGDEERWPFRVLFAFKVDRKLFDTLEESFATEGSEKYPFDAFVFLDRGVYVSEKYEIFRKGFAKGLSPEMADKDVEIYYQQFSDDLTANHIRRGFGRMHGGKPAESLFAFAALAAFASSGDQTTQALLTACRDADYNPIFEDENDDANKVAEEVNVASDTLRSATPMSDVANLPELEDLPDFLNT